ncbi:MAG: beta-lactamase family protein [Ferruginibacter sp.]|nr:beta-lactamase family protein [Cytophagales bacterium]
MKKTSLLLAALFLGLVALAQPPQAFKTASPAAAGFSPERLQRLDAYLQRLVDGGQAPNAVTFVAHRGQVVHHQAFGYRNRERKEPLRKDDIFRIASQSKAVTTVALLMLWEEGKFGLDDPVSKYIPAFRNPKVLDQHDPKTGQYTTHPAKSEVTIRQLLSHTAGIPYQHPLQERPEFKVPFFNSLEKETLAETIPRLAARPLTAEPGSAFVYGLNTDVLGYLVEILSGKNLAEVLRQRIFEPLGMTDTDFYLPDAKAGRLVELYSLAKPGDPLTVHENAAYRKFAVSGARTYHSGGAGLVSTVEDYAKFCQMLLNGGGFNGKQLLGPKTVALMSRNQIGELEVWDRRDKFGLGLQIVTERSHYGDQASVGSLTWGGLYCSEFTIDPREELILLVFTNVEPYAHYSDFVRKFRILVYQALQ